MKTVQATVVEGVHQLTGSGNSEKDNQQKSTRRRDTGSHKKNSPTSLEAKRIGAKQISIHGIPLVKFQIVYLIYFFIIIDI